jgi:hypothetical protein
MKSYKPYKKYYESKNSKSFRSNKFKHNKKQHVCYKCGQTGHYKNNCKVKDKIKELNIDDKLKSQLLNILSESDTESEELLQIDDNNTTSQDDEYFDSSEENEIGFCLCKDKNMCTCRKEINTLTREERIILELIYQIEDPEKKNIYIYLSQISQKEKIITNGINYNFTDVSNRFKKEKRTITIQDLQLEIHNIKQEIKELKFNFNISNEQLVQEIITLKSGTQQTNKILKNDSEIKTEEMILQNDSEIKIEEIQGNNKANSDDNNLFINLIDRIIFQKWYVKITLIINAEFQITTVALIP